MLREPTARSDSSAKAVEPHWPVGYTFKRKPPDVNTTGPPPADATPAAGFLKIPNDSTDHFPTAVNSAEGQ